ncbi:PAS domain-containing sensor histidine kinase [Microvirga terricola]|uniref:histidine kinase n=1 Tax=Microvirga terricola TaxID=2719797 RepID=A0ABX0VI07_9HYPH|nr:PAS domain-containing sensor histidine kinase [Microvirga terricola]NIX78072.1 PAS domain S-box protein [Microvirga terricola]
MTDAPNPFEAMIARLAADPALAMMAKPGMGVLVWDLAIERLLWASPVAEGLGDVFADAEGKVLPGFRASDRLKALAGGLAPRQGMRLERLRLDPTQAWMPVTCACRLADLPTGETVLVTAIVGPVPKVSPKPRAVPTAEASAAIAPDVVLPPKVAKPTTVRFVWQADAATRFIHVSPNLVEAVGPAAGNIVGRTWDEVSRSVARDPEGAIASLFAHRETWSGRTIFWSLDSSPKEVPVDWAGMPIFGDDRALVGFRGFGLLRMDAAREAEQPDEELPAPNDEAAADDEESPDLTTSDDESWFAHLRDRVAEALASSKPVAPEEVRSEQAFEPTAKPAVVPARQSTLSSVERNAFREIARALGARVETAPVEETPAVEEQEAAPAVPPEAPGSNGDKVLDRLPIGVLVHQGEEVLFANRFLLDLTGYDDIDQIAREGGLVSLFRGSPVLQGADEGGSQLALTNRRNESVAVEVRPAAAEWNGEPASVMVIRKAPEADQARLRAVEWDLREHESRVHELESILDTATDGVIVFDETGRILSLNRSAEALFGYDQRDVVGDAITVLLAPESHIVALGYLEGLRSPGVASLLNDGREVLGRVRQGGTIPLFMTMGHVNDGPQRKFCAVLRDITPFKKAEGELVGAKRAAEQASAQKSDLLAKISHEIRTPLNAIIGFAEVMLEERFGPIGNERYKNYLKDVHASGAHVISLVNDLLDLAKVEAGRMELTFTSVNLNDLVSSCVALLQPQAARDRIVMRTSFAVKLPPVVADERSMRQIALNLISNAIKFTDAGGQVIISTALTDRGEVAFRVRDTGIGMTENEIEAALEPFRQLATSRKRGGTGLGLPLTKALVESNRGALQISSHPNDGTLVEVIFPPTRVLAE